MATANDLPSECVNCLHLHCGYIRMNGDNEYSCFKVPVFMKYKKERCEYKEEVTEDAKRRNYTSA